MQPADEQKKQRGKPPKRDTTVARVSILLRMEPELAEKLTKSLEDSRQSKNDFICSLIASYLRSVEPLRALNLNSLNFSDVFTELVPNKETPNDVHSAQHR